MLDAAFEAAKGSSKIGTTGKGIGPTYTDKISRNGVRVGDIFLDFKKIYEVAKARHENILESLGYNYDIDELERQWFEGIEYLKSSASSTASTKSTASSPKTRPFWPKAHKVRCSTSISVRTRS